MVNQSAVILTAAIGGIILTLSLLILFHQNANATKGYTLRTLERERSELLLEEEVLKMQIADAQALKRLEQDPVIALMIPVRGAKFVEGEETMAREVAKTDNSNRTVSCCFCRIAVLFNCLQATT